MTFEEIFETEKDRLFRYAGYRMGDIADAEDTIQDLFVSLSAKKNRLDNVDNIKAYIYRSMINLCNEKVHKKSDTVSLSDFPEFDVAELNPTNFEEEFNLIDKLLKNLPEEQNETIRLRIYCDLTFDEIAATTNVNVSTAKARFRYGIEKLRNELKRQNLM